MKPSSAINKKNITNADDSFIALTINKQIMKKLANTSPFLLLLLPVFMMLILTLMINTNQTDAEVVVKPATSSNAIVKQATAIFK
ncbi:hypothetical protein DU508_08345 [Pedobacter chinensis]|uniref:Uncharacterized protein n=1 Tax=Pedobacter chinensis TaxID=2282421 RepID=A0A369Q1R4_9SPHI|nr:hypothetical protein [Pedobacter chinensis]RDC57187.1 hypothetical protein DU508_08345 [Pedobacter chinensis]